VIKCPNCGRDNAANFNFCLDCGYDLKAWREAFPDGIPAVPPPPAPAMTNPIGMVAPTAMPPGNVASPLPPAPAPAASAATFPPMPPMAPAPMPQPPMPMAPPPMAQPPMAMPPAMPMPPANLPPTYTPGPQPAPLPMPPANLPVTYTPGPQPAPLPMPPAFAPMPAPPAAMSTGMSSSMPGPEAYAPPAAPPQAPMPQAPLPRTATPMPVAPPVSVSVEPSAAAKLCVSCGYENAASVKFCGNCGKRLDAPAGPAAAGPPAEGDGVQRTMFMHAADMSSVVKEKICKLVTIDQAGREGMTFTIKSGETICGRVNGIILFFDDPFVSPTHCKFAFHGGVLKVIDLQSLNGVYLRVKQERRLADGELIRLGRQLFRFESMKSASFQIKKAEGDDSRIWGSPTATAFGRLVQILDDGRTGEIRLLTGERGQVGREVGDVVIPTDGFISGRHCVFMLQNGEPVLADLGSSNGTYVRVRGEAEVAHGDFVLVGNQMLRVEIA
jgi:pSer/pThr/pTyr-binding forkhead associated (FHA) protein